MTTQENELNTVFTKSLYTLDYKFIVKEIYAN